MSDEFDDDELNIEVEEGTDNSEDGDGNAHPLKRSAKKEKPPVPPFSGETYAFDTETTGLSAKFNRITEVAIVGFDPLTGESFLDDPSKVYHTFINPEQEVPPEVVAVHGMTWDMLKAYPTFKELAENIANFMRGHKIVAHNLRFDKSFINEEFKRAKTPYKLEELAHELEDTLVLSRSNVIAKKHRLDDICDRHGVDRTKRVLHDARGDCILLAEVYPYLMTEVKRNIEAVSKVLPFALGDISFDVTDMELMASRYLNIQTLVKILEKDSKRYLEALKLQAEGASQSIGDEMEIVFTNTTKTDWKRVQKEKLPKDFNIREYQTQSSSTKVSYK